MQEIIEAIEKRRVDIMDFIDATEREKSDLNRKVNSCADALARKKQELAVLNESLNLVKGVVGSSKEGS